MATSNSELLTRIERLEKAITEIAAQLGGLRHGHAPNVTAISGAGFETTIQPNDAEQR